MNMQDKDLDQLFRSKLDGFEAEPTARVWDNINRELGAPAKRKSLVPMLRIAATIAVVVAAGLFFLPKKQLGTDQPKPIKLAAKPVNIKPETIRLDDSQQPTAPARQVQPVIPVHPQQHLVASVNRPTVKTPVLPANAATAVNKDQNTTITEARRPELIAAVDTKVKVTNPVIPDIQIIDRAVAPIKQDVLAAAVSTGDSTPPAPVKKHRIHGLGGLINAVVAAVDKREDKIIEFTDTDEGDSVTGINLGILKVKKQK